MTFDEARGQPGGAVFEIVRQLCLWAYRRAGWRVEGELPTERKFVIIAAPHTSNWDLPLMIGVALDLRMPIRWMGKKSLFRGPLGPVMRALGGIAIDRSRSTNVVEQMVAAFGAADTLAIAIPPEGTRADVDHWKSGFYNIAVGAGVPIALGFLDYRRKVGGIIRTYHPTGSLDRDMPEIRSIYAGITSRRALRATRRRPGG